jgi:tripartite-type tricarboxylate transporter receptor subunit TctC
MAAIQAATAQTFPSRPVKLVVGFTPGGGVDIAARTLAPKLSELIGQPVIVENKPGAGTNIANEFVAKAAPDGTTLLVNTPAVAINMSLYRNLPFDTLRDFAAVSIFSESPNVMMVNSKLAAQNLQEFIAYVKQNHAKLQYGSGGTGTSSHITCVLLGQKIGADVTHVPYRGGGPAFTDLIAGRLDYFCNYISFAVQAAGTGQARTLAIFAHERSPVIPAVPTAAEQGLDGVDAYTWNAVFAPRGTPPAVVAKLNAAVSRALDTPLVRERLGGLGLDVPPRERRTPEFLRRYVVDEMARWAPAVKASGAGEE